MNILLINYEYPPIGAGAANATFFLAKAFKNMGHNITVLTSGIKHNTGFSIEDSINIFRINTFRKKQDGASVFEMFSFALFSIFKIQNIAKKNNIDKAIIFFTIPCGHLGLTLKKNQNIDYVISLRGGDVPGLVPDIKWIHNILAPIRRKILKHSLAIIANDKGLANLSEISDPFNVSIIHNGVDIDLFIPVAKNNNLIFSFLFVGRFQPQKNLFFLLDQIAELKKRTHIPFEFNMVGDGFLKKELTMHTEKLNIIELVHWHGWKTKEDLILLYQKANCFINPSLFEGMPNVVLEAMACGLPVIASDIPGNDSTVINNTTGILCSLNSPSDFQNAMLRMLENKNIAKQYGCNGRIRIEENFSWQKTAFEYLKILKAN